MDNELFQHVTTQDFMEYGFEPEFIGRLPYASSVRTSTRRSIRHHEVFRGQLLRQYERAFRAYGIEISFEDEALRLLAQAARRKNRRARVADRV
jgi:ATP-dependent protease Clp, ATPase subunit